MKGMKHVVIYLTTYSFHGHQKLQILVIDNVVNFLLTEEYISSIVEGKNSFG
jgi:hypothetical protein